jgi:hypothetical protein
MPRFPEAYVPIDQPLTEAKTQDQQPMSKAKTRVGQTTRRSVRYTQPEVG